MSDNRRCMKECKLTQHHARLFANDSTSRSMYVHASDHLVSIMLSVVPNGFPMEYSVGTRIAYDGCCGDGGMLSKTLQLVREPELTLQMTEPRTFVHFQNTLSTPQIQQLNACTSQQHIRSASEELTHLRYHAETPLIAETTPTSCYSTIFQMIQCRLDVHHSHSPLLVVLMRSFETQKFIITPQSSLQSIVERWSEVIGESLVLITYVSVHKPTVVDSWLV